VFFVVVFCVLVWEVVGLVCGVGSFWFFSLFTVSPHARSSPPTPLFFSSLSQP